MRSTFANSEYTEVAQIKGELQEIYSTKDLEILLSVLKGDKDDKLLQAIEQEVDNSSSPDKPSQQPKEASDQAEQQSADGPSNRIQAAQIAKQLLQIEEL